jgi:hypothetical protein
VAEIETDNEEHINEIQMYIKRCGQWWNDSLIEKADKILSSFKAEHE